MRIDPRAAFTIALAAGLAAAIYTARDWPVETRMLPWVLGIPGLLLALVQLALDIRARGTTEETAAADLIDLPADRSLPPKVVMRRVSAFYGWFLGLIAGVWLFGFFIAVPVFVFFFLLLRAGEKWWSAAIYTGATLGFLWLVFERILRVLWPQGAVLVWLGF
ncbi:MAG: tripartite tricarboxylate transporter TctB family protein [Deltaproteobacteria bacterium]|nr:tripartite tricarboxylate transporter TctB family protein [Deltaproteobacteria bacterium]